MQHKVHPHGQDVAVWPGGDVGRCGLAGHGGGHGGRGHVLVRHGHRWVGHGGGHGGVGGVGCGHGYIYTIIITIIGDYNDLGGFVEADKGGHEQRGSPIGRVARPCS